MSTKFRVSIAATWFAKYRRLRLNKAPKPSKIPRYSVLKAGRVAKVDAGEDAFFQISTPRYHYFGVADGVGSWDKSGIDPSYISWSLMNRAHNKVKEGMNKPPDSKEANLSALELLDMAYESVVREKSVTAGSSTASLLRFDKISGILDSANLGDSSFMVIRNRNEVVYRAPEQHHFFNCPYQLAIIPKGPSRDGYVSDKPSDADVKSIQLVENDIVLLATDGYFDNMFDEETINGVQNLLENFETMNVATNLDPDKIHNHSFYFGDKSLYNLHANSNASDWIDVKIRKMCHKLAATARLNSLNQIRKTPWTEYVLKNYPYHEAAGKVDDITVLVALIQNVVPL